MNSLGNVLKKSQIFKGLESGDLDMVMPLFHERILHTGDVLTASGDSAQFFFLLGKGTLLLAMDGGKAVVLDSAGDFAAMELMSREGVYTTSVTALEDGVAWAVPREAFFDFIRQDTPAAAEIMAAWQIFLDAKAGFAKVIADIDAPVIS
ncbi:MAG: cyclic nucleotide-binding domain-containing protein [Desulfobacter sp.]